MTVKPKKHKEPAAPVLEEEDDDEEEDYGPAYVKGEVRLHAHVSCTNSALNMIYGVVFVHGFII